MAHSRPSNDPHFQNVGQVRGEEIWRIKNFDLVKVPKSEYGCFYTGDSYIVLHTEHRGSWNVHFWLGKETSVDEKGTAAVKAVELDDSLGGLPVQYREVQGHESPLFLSYFKGGIKYLLGGFASGFRPVSMISSKDFKPRLFHCKGKKNVRCTEVPCKASSLNTGDVFVLDCGEDIYLWMPPDCGRLERIRGMGQAVSIRNNERAGRAKIHPIDSDWDTNEEFWAALGESYDPRVVTSGGSDDESDQIATKGPSLWKVSDASGRLQISKIADGNFKTSMLDPNDAFILDSGKEVFVWIGKQCTHNERTKAMSWAQEYLQKSGRPAWTQIVRVLQSAEPAIFTQWFGVWDMRTQQATPHFLPRLFQCSDRSGRLAVEEIARFTQQDLESDDVMILDALNTIFVWIGSGSSDAEKTHALTAAQTYLKMSAIPRQNVSTQVIFQGQETSEFKKHFPEWK